MNSKIKDVKELLVQYAAYNAWANNKLIAVVKGLAQQDLHKEVPSSFSSVEKTLLHLWDAESIWWQRLKLQEHINRPSDTKDLKLAEIINGITQLDHQWLTWVSNASEAALQHVFAYQNTKREQFKQPVCHMLLHLFNHSTYHRGQLVTILHYLKLSGIPATDFIVWSRSVKPV